MKRVTCKSGIKGWQCYLRDNYIDFETFAAYAEARGLHTRLGFKTIAGAWKANPLIQGSVNPSDYRRVLPSAKKKSKATYRKLFHTEPHAAQIVSLVTHNGESPEPYPVTSGAALIRITEAGNTTHIVFTGEEMTNLAKQWLALVGEKI